jgi:tRNA/rRNA methyltransferase
MTEGVRLDHIAIVLHRPQIPENIGAAARAMQNMGLRRLIVVAPENFEMARMRMMATHGGIGIVESMERRDDLPTALGPFNFVACTTARLGGQRRTVCSPAELARQLIPLSRENHIAIVFGPEDRGLSNEDIRYSHYLVNIPTAEFSSLNLAQAVMVVCYELFKAETREKSPFVPRLANRFELDAMYAQLADILVRISYINPENPEYWVNNLRRFFNRYPLRAKEVAIIRGICRQIDWYGNKRYNDGLEAATPASTTGDPPGKEGIDNR